MLHFVCLLMITSIRVTVCVSVCVCVCVGVWVCARVCTSSLWPQETGILARLTLPSQLLVTTFHPELSQDHRWGLSMSDDCPLG